MSYTTTLILKMVRPRACGLSGVSCFLDLLVFTAYKILFPKEGKDFAHSCNNLQLIASLVLFILR